MKHSRDDFAPIESDEPNSDLSPHRRAFRSSPMPAVEELARRYLWAQDLSLWLGILFMVPVALLVWGIFLYVILRDLLR